MFQPKPPFIRAIEGEQIGGSSGAITEQPDQTATNAEPTDTASPDGRDPENKKDAHARGLKPQVFADLAGDRDRR